MQEQKKQLRQLCKVDQLNPNLAASDTELLQHPLACPNCWLHQTQLPPPPSSVWCWPIMQELSMQGA